MTDTPIREQSALELLETHAKALEAENKRLGEIYRREREAHAANLKEQQKCEAEIARLGRTESS